MKNDFFTNNLWLKIASLVCGITLWFFVILSGQFEISMDVPIIFSNIPPELDIVEYPKTVRVSIEGQERLLENLKQKEISAVIDMEQTMEGKVFFTLSKDNIDLPAMLSVKSIEPETIGIKIETLCKKTVTVKPAVVGLPEKGFAIAGIKVTPESVELEGPKSKISKIRTIKTEPLDINGINSDLRYRASLNLSDPNIRKNINKVEVFISVKKIK